MSYLSPSLKMENLPKQPIMTLDHLTEQGRYNRAQIVAKWCIPMNGKMFRIELEHGTTSGRRMIWVNGKEVLRRDWMFKLVGEDTFDIEGKRCIIRVDPAPGFRYDYLFFIDGKSYDQYTDEQVKAYRLWVARVEDVEYRVVLELDSLNITLNDVPRDETPDFIDGGTETHFEENGIKFVLLARSSGNKHEGIVHTLFVNGVLVPETKLHERTEEFTSILS